MMPSTSPGATWKLMSVQRLERRRRLHRPACHALEQVAGGLPHAGRLTQDELLGDVVDFDDGLGHGRVR
jgi:hypothetical protein